MHVRNVRVDDRDIGTAGKFDAFDIFSGGGAMDPAAIDNYMIRAGQHDEIVIAPGGAIGFRVGHFQSHQPIVIGSRISVYDVANVGQPGDPRHHIAGGSAA
jgi:hypothetical protein